MNKLTKSIVGSTTLAGLATLAPLSLDVGSTGAAVRLTTACGQAGSCVFRPGFVCVSGNIILRDYMCATGCGS
ncbi:MAG: hypothetical protein ACJ8J0_21625 [Longimicrobiaceae bacterium]